jgi:hypothetical protein
MLHNDEGLTEKRGGQSRQEWQTRQTRQACKDCPNQPQPSYPHMILGHHPGNHICCMIAPCHVTIYSMSLTTAYISTFPISIPTRTTVSTLASEFDFRSASNRTPADEGKTTMFVEPPYCSLACFASARERLTWNHPNSSPFRTLSPGFLDQPILPTNIAAAESDPVRFGSARELTSDRYKGYWDSLSTRTEIRVDKHDGSLIFREHVEV